MDSVDRWHSPSDPARRAHLVDFPIFWLVNLFAYIRHPFNVKLFRRRVGYFPNIALPRRYNEKMLWRKIFDHNPLFADSSSTCGLSCRKPGNASGSSQLISLLLGPDR